MHACEFNDCCSSKYMRWLHEVPLSGLQIHETAIAACVRVLKHNMGTSLTSIAISAQASVRVLKHKVDTYG